MGRKNLALVSRGFTLIELLVVISIMGILVTVISVSFTTGQKRSRDTKRRADLLAVQQSLEQCFALNNAYPLTAGVVFGSALSCGLQTTMNQVPLDPKNSDSYVYTYSAAADQSSYCLCALLEQSGVGNSDNSCNFTSGGDYLCSANQQ